MEPSGVGLSVVVPCLDEAGVLEPLYAELVDAVAGLVPSFEIIFVDDGSTDDTLAVIRRLAVADPAVRYLSLSRNFGKEAAMLAGLRYSRGDAVVLMDADLQHPPALIAELLQQHRKGFDQVVARRTRTHETWHRTLAARAYYRLMGRLVDVELLDGGGDFRLLSRRAVEALLAMPEVNRFSKGLYAWVGFDASVIDYDNVERASGSSKWSLSKLLNYGINGVLSFNDRPLRVAIYLGIGVTALSAVYVIAELARTILFGVDVPGYVTLITAIVGLGGLQLLFLGVVGEYLGKVYYESKRRPHYIVREDNISAGGVER